MGFIITIEGSVDDADQAPAVEGELIADLRGVIAKHGAHITLGSGTFDYSGNVDLSTSDTDSPVEDGNGHGGEPVPVTPFVTKVEGETYNDYQARLFTYNAGVPIEQQAPSLGSLEWSALPVG